MIDTPDVRIAMWSGPRNISTAIMRSFENRSDTCVTDEPFYGAYLKHTGIRQPMCDRIIASMECEWGKIKLHLNEKLPKQDCSIWYQKHMPHHMVAGISIKDFPNHRHAFLIRDPCQVIASYAAKHVEVSLDDLGFERQWDYIQYCCDKSGKTPAIFDASDVLANPEAMLKIMCSALSIEWDDRMLFWETGLRTDDGIWAEHWYNQVRQSSGFGRPQKKKMKLSTHQHKIADECQPFYAKMEKLKLTI